MLEAQKIELSEKTTIPNSSSHHPSSTNSNNFKIPVSVSKYNVNGKVVVPKSSTNKILSLNEPMSTTAATSSSSSSPAYSPATNNRGNRNVAFSSDTGESSI